MEKIFSLASVRRILTDRKYNLAAISRATGLSYQQVWKTVKKTKNPPYLVVAALSEYIAKEFDNELS